MVCSQHCYIIELRDVRKHYYKGGSVIKAFDDLSLEIRKGSMTAIICPSGSGKTPLLNIIGALDKPVSGIVYVDGKILNNLSKKESTLYRRFNVGFVFQTFNLIPNLTALESVILPMEFAGVPARERVSRAMKLLEIVGVVARANHTPVRLSGGEQQRVAIARALANDPHIILADEPTGNLDSETGRQIIELLHQLSKDKDKTVVIVTHSEEARRLADETYMIRDGKIIK